MARKQKVEEAIKHEVSQIIQRELNDPRVGFTTVTRVELSVDLKYAKIFVSVLGEKDKAGQTFDALKRAQGFIRKLLAQRLRMRFVPEISFKEDNSSEYSVRIAKIIDELKNENKTD